MSTKQTPSGPTPLTQTDSNPPAPLIDSVVELLFSPNHTPFSIAAHFQLSLLALARLVATPDVQAAIALVESLFRRHASLEALAALRRSLHVLDSIANLPQSPSPAECDRARRAAETTRRAADLIRKFILPPPVQHAPRARRAPAPDLDATPATPTLLALAPLTSPTVATPALPPPATPSTLHFATPSPDHSATSSPTSSPDPADINLDHINPNSPEYWDILLCLQTAHPDLRTKRPDLFASRPPTSVSVA
jgi:hypothetical protein